MFAIAYELNRNTIASANVPSHKKRIDCIFITKAFLQSQPWAKRHLFSAIGWFLYGWHTWTCWTWKISKPRQHLGWGAFIQSPNWMTKAGGPLPLTLGFIIGGLLMLVVGCSYAYMIGKYPVASGPMLDSALPPLTFVAGCFLSDIFPL